MWINSPFVVLQFNKSHTPKELVKKASSFEYTYQLLVQFLKRRHDCTIKSTVVSSARPHAVHAIKCQTPPPAVTFSTTTSS